MATDPKRSPTTRSIHGATYVPIDWNNPEDTGNRENRDSETSNRVTPKKSFLSPRVFDWGNFLIKLLGDRENGAIVIDAYRKKYLNTNSDALPAAERDAHEKLLNLMDFYLKGGQYKSLVKELKDVDLDPLKTFSRNWLAIEKELLSRSLNDVMAATCEAVIELSAKIEKPEADDLKEMAKKVNEGFLNISKEIADLRRDVVSIRSKEKETAESKSNADGAIGVTASSKSSTEQVKSVQPMAVSKPQVKVTGLSSVSAKDIWRRILEKDERRISAKFLERYYIPGMQPKALHSNAMIKILNKATGMISTQVAEGLSEGTMQIAILEDITTEMTAVISVAEKQKEAWVYQTLESMEMEPAGYLALERLDFTPLGYVRGELVYSLPLTPGENITVSHKEWSNTTEEYVSVVETTFEEERLKAVSEKTELMESTRSEKEVTQHGEASAEASFSGRNWSVAARGGWSGDWQNSRAAETGSRRNQEITSKAASRSKKEHKMTFRVAREVHVEDEQVRTIQNTSDKPVRWDFHRLMQKWKIELYHTGERLTWDVVIPEPGLFLLRKYKELKGIIEEIDAGDPFDVTTEAFTQENYEKLALKWGAFLERYPEEYSLDYEGLESYQKNPREGYSSIRVEVPEGYKIAQDFAGNPAIKRLVPDRDNNYDTPELILWDTISWINNWEWLQWEANRSSIQRMREFIIPWRYTFKNGAPDNSTIHVVMRVTFTPSEEGMRTWRIECWNRLREAARAKWIIELEGLQARRDRLIEELTGKDSLKLRQMEQEEIMKAVIRWMLGPEYMLYKSGAQEIAEALTGEKETDAATILQRVFLRHEILEYGEDVRFINQAIEWENVNWITYPYFWSAPEDWEFKQSLDHPDFYHRNFLRAGWSRVVLTIRPGFEKAWLARMAGLKEDDLIGDHPYLTLAQEIEARSHNFYAYTLDANRDELVTFGKPVDTWLEYTPTGALDISEGAVLENK
jgi:hypothetical protein